MIGFELGSEQYRCPRFGQPETCNCGACHQHREIVTSKAALKAAYARNFAPAGSTFSNVKAIAEPEESRETTKEKHNRQCRERYAQLEKATAPTLISDNFGKPPPKLELQLCYDDSEKTYASNVPYRVIFNDPSGTVIKGVLNDKGWALVEGGPNYPAKVIFGEEVEKIAAESVLEAQYQQLDNALNATSQQVAQHIITAKDRAKQRKQIEVTASFKAAVDSKVAELNAQSEAFDNLSYLSQTWALAKATKAGTSNGVTGYLPDLGDFGELMDAADIDITMLIDAISTGNINDLEAKLQQWKARGGEGFKQAHKSMETLILLLSDPTSREMLASVPKRIIAALPEDQLAELTAYQMTQMGMDTAVVTGGTALGTLAGGVGGPIAAGTLFAATSARKGGKALEGTINIVTDISKSLKKINNHHEITAYKKEYTLPLATGKDKSNDKNDEDDETYKCDWKNCKGGHKKKIKYPNNGKTAKNSTYADDWRTKGLEPWDLYGASNVASASYQDYANELSSINKTAKDHIEFSMSENGHYTTQKHHVIPAGVADKFTILKKNIQLAGWDINDKENGLCLPFFVNDIRRHGLQCHRGGHPKKYNKVVADILEAIEDDSKNLCSTENHKALLKDLELSSQQIKKKILSWSNSFLLRSTAKQEKQEYGGYKR